VPLIIAQLSMLHLSNLAHYMNTFSILPTVSHSTTIAPIVLLHGYSADLSFFFQNFPTLSVWSKCFQAPMYVLDWLGMGHSARVPFKVHVKRDDIPHRVTEAEGFFINSLEEWWDKMGLKQMMLMGHSLGVYCSISIVCSILWLSRSFIYR